MFPKILPAVSPTSGVNSNVMTGAYWSSVYRIRSFMSELGFGRVTTTIPVADGKPRSNRSCASRPPELKT